MTLLPAGESSPLLSAALYLLIGRDGPLTYQRSGPRERSSALVGGFVVVVVVVSRRHLGRHLVVRQVAECYATHKHTLVEVIRKGGQLATQINKLAQPRSSSLTPQMLSRRPSYSRAYLCCFEASFASTFFGSTFEAAAWCSCFL